MFAGGADFNRQTLSLGFYSALSGFHYGAQCELGGANRKSFEELLAHQMIRELTGRMLR